MLLERERCEIRVPGDDRELSREQRDGENEVDRAGGDRVLRHAVVLRRTRVLDQGGAALSLYRLYASRTIGGGTGKNHGYGVGLAVQCAEK